MELRKYWSSVRAFAGMRNEIQQANRALLESERLATIGRMASSVSHDFRHYLATIYANSEFLVGDQFSSKERAEIFADIRTAVLGTTDMIESLLIFSRTGASIRRSPELMATLLERAIALIRTHPDAEGVRIETRMAILRRQGSSSTRSRLSAQSSTCFSTPASPFALPRMQPMSW
jgi:signal transduction histidine kinase